MQGEIEAEQLRRRAELLENELHQQKEANHQLQLKHVRWWRSWRATAPSKCTVLLTYMQRRCVLRVVGAVNGPATAAVAAGARHDWRGNHRP